MEAGKTKVIKTEEFLKQCFDRWYIDGFLFHYDPIREKCGGGWVEYYGQKCTIFGLEMPESMMYPFLLDCIIHAINSDLREPKVQIAQYHDRMIRSCIGEDQGNVLYLDVPYNHGNMGDEKLYSVVDARKKIILEVLELLSGN